MLPGGFWFLGDKSMQKFVAGTNKGLSLTSLATDKPLVYMFIF